MPRRRKPQEPCSTALLPADNTGHSLAVATPQAGNPHDPFALADVFTERCNLLETAQLRLDGLVLNADKYLNINKLCQACVRRASEAHIPLNRLADRRRYASGPLIPRQLP